MKDVLSNFLNKKTMMESDRRKSAAASLRMSLRPPGGLGGDESAAASSASALGLSLGQMEALQKQGASSPEDEDEDAEEETKKPKTRRTEPGPRRTGRDTVVSDGSDTLAALKSPKVRKSSPSTLGGGAPGAAAAPPGGRKSAPPGAPDTKETRTEGRRGSDTSTGSGGGKVRFAADLEDAFGDGFGGRSGGVARSLRMSMKGPPERIFTSDFNAAMADPEPPPSPSNSKKKAR